MKISEFLTLEGEFQISANDVQILNNNLSKLSDSDIPKEKFDHVLDYLIAVLNAGSVEPNIEPKLESLASDLQAIR